tara:strand:+ start:205 stop:630 length:426 start_codon:yes stop_codon:yes gene_type:complete
LEQVLITGFAFGAARLCALLIGVFITVLLIRRSLRKLEQVDNGEIDGTFEEVMAVPALLWVLCMVLIVSFLATEQQHMRPKSKMPQFYVNELERQLEDMQEEGEDIAIPPAESDNDFSESDAEIEAIKRSFEIKPDEQSDD